MEDKKFSSSKARFNKEQIVEACDNYIEKTNAFRLSECERRIDDIYKEYVKGFDNFIVKFLNIIFRYVLFGRLKGFQIEPCGKEYHFSDDSIFIEMFYKEYKKEYIHRAKEIKTMVNNCQGDIFLSAEDAHFLFKINDE